MSSPQATNLFFFSLVTWHHLVSGACLGFIGYLAGGTAAVLAGMSKPQVTNGSRNIRKSAKVVTMSLEWVPPASASDSLGVRS